MNHSLEGTEIRVLKLVLPQEAGVDYLNEAAALIRELAPVCRVRVDPRQFHLEILYRHPARGLLQKIHQAQLTVDTQLTHLRPY
jgi:hypothetical protein